MEMKSLYDLINEILYGRGVPFSCNSVDDILDDNKAAKFFINDLLGYSVVKSRSKFSSLYSVADSREPHSVVSFFLGLILSEFGGLRSAVTDSLKALTGKDLNLFLRAWIITSLSHDRGYFSHYLEKIDLDYEKEFPYNLLTDDYSNTPLEFLSSFANVHDRFMAYSYEQISKYDGYARDYHRNTPSKEKIDHGILGGVLSFNQYAENIGMVGHEYYQSEMLLAKACSVTIAQHNIYKSSSKENDAKYPKGLECLYHNSGHVIKQDKPLLLLLCLVDTIECVKRFSRKQSPKSYFLPSTVLSAIKVDVSKEKITIDLSDLEERVMKKTDDLKRTFESYRRGLTKFSDWTAVSGRADDQNPNIITLTIS